jgi:hypothetical protein
LREKIRSELSAEGIDPQSVNIKRGPTGYLTVTDPKGRLSGAFDVAGFGDALNLADRFRGEAPDENTAGLGDRFESIDAIENAAISGYIETLADVPVEWSGGTPDNLGSVTVEEATRIEVGERVTLNQPDGSASPVFSSEQAASTFARTLAQIPDDIRTQISTDALAEDSDLAQRMDERSTRSNLRNELNQTLEAEGYDPGRWNTDARADGTLILQDPESNRTQTISPGEGAESFTPDVFNTTDASPSPSPESNEIIPDMSGNRPRIVAVILGIIAVIYGVMQS